MSGVGFVAKAKCTLGVSRTKTTLQANARSNQRAELDEVVCTLEETTGSLKQAVVQIARQTTAGSMSTTITAKKRNDSDDESIQTTFLGALDADSENEPTTTDILDERAINVCGGQFYFRALNEKERIPILGGTRMGVVVNAPVACTAHTILKGFE